MKILVTGANGFLGTALVERLLCRGERDVRCLVRPGRSTSGIEALARRYQDAKVEILVGSLVSREDATCAVAKVDLVHHLAASHSGAPADIFLNTVVGSRNLLDAIVATGARPKMVLVSSFGVYGVAGLPRGARIDESTPLEEHPEWRDVYSHAKLRQERLVREYAARHGFPLVVVRPGVIYGRGGIRISARVGLEIAGVFLFLGGGNLLPLTYVENCADAVAIVGAADAANGETYNVVDDEPITARQFLDRYRREVRRFRALPVPYPVLQFGSRLVVAYSTWSKGQLPPVFTPYRTATTWKGATFTNESIRRLGWRPLVSTEEGLRRSFQYYRTTPR